MKRKITLFIALMVLVLAVGMMFGGCSSKYVGEYKFQKMSYKEDGMVVELEVGEKYMGMISLSEDFMTIELKDDNTAIMKSETETKVVSEGTWKKGESSDEIILQFEGGDEVTVKYVSGTLTLEEDGATLVLKK